MLFSVSVSSLSAFSVLTGCIALRHVPAKLHRNYAEMRQLLMNEHACWRQMEAVQRVDIMPDVCYVRHCKHHDFYPRDHLSLQPGSDHYERTVCKE